MAQQKDSSGGTYLYAVIAGTDEKTYGPIGIDGGEVYCLSHGTVAAVVSNLTQAALRPQRRHLAAHERVLKRLLEDGSPLPMSFGAVADGPEDIRNMLASHEEVLVEQLERIHGRVEMGLRVRWDVPNPIEHLLAQHEELRAARDQAFRGGREPSPAERMELGRLVEHLLSEERATRAERVEQVLRPRCVEIREGKLRDERELVSLACLVERGTEDAFARGVVEAASQFDAHCCFDYNGPWPAHSFVDLNLHWYFQGIAMLVFDNLVWLPMRGLLRIFREIHKAAEQECENEGEAIRAELRELYMKLEIQQITEAEFDAAETVLLDRLDRLEPPAAETDHEAPADN